MHADLDTRRRGSRHSSQPSGTAQLTWLLPRATGGLREGSPAQERAPRCSVLENATRSGPVCCVARCLPGLTMVGTRATFRPLFFCLRTQPRISAAVVKTSSTPSSDAMAADEGSVKGYGGCCECLCAGEWVPPQRRAQRPSRCWRRRPRCADGLLAEPHRCCVWPVRVCVRKGGTERAVGSGNGGDGVVKGGLSRRAPQPEHRAPSCSFLLPHTPNSHGPVHPALSVRCLHRSSNLPTSLRRKPRFPRHAHPVAPLGPHARDMQRSRVRRRRMRAGCQPLGTGKPLLASTAACQVPTPLRCRWTMKRLCGSRGSKTLDWVYSACCERPNPFMQVRFLACFS
jgi:hypothetical protein